VLPSVMPGVLVGLVMNFTLAISDFVYANLLVGGHFPTLQIFMGILKGGSGRVISNLITVYFLVVFVATSIVIWVTSRRSTA
jgi:putative spermidine/putrescine transport system permease protein